MVDSESSIINSCNKLHRHTVQSRITLSVTKDRIVDDHCCSRSKRFPENYHTIHRFSLRQTSKVIYIDTSDPNSMTERVRVLIEAKTAWITWGNKGNSTHLRGFQSQWRTRKQLGARASPSLKRRSRSGIRFRSNFGFGIWIISIRTKSKMA